MNDAPVSTPDLSVVIPVYKNRETLAELKTRIVNVCTREKISVELIYVDDHCPADSWSIIQELAAQDERIHGLALNQNVGQQRAVNLGLHHTSGHAVAVMDADLQDPPEALPNLLAELQQGYEAVFAGRRGQYQGAHRLISSRIFKQIIAFLTGVPADAGMYVMMSRRLVDRLIKMNPSRPYLVGLIGLTYLPITSIPVERAQRPVGQSAYSAWARLDLGLGAVGHILSWRLGLLTHNTEERKIDYATTTRRA
jgi:polyisoprenyl-phosphate glycosyltransferase